jgi:predicted amidohydrolase
MRVAVIQFRATNNVSDNVLRAVKVVERAIKAKAQFILLPEVFVCRGITDYQSVSDDVNGKILRPLRELAQKHRVFILAGSILERIKKSSKVYNTSVLIGSRGQIVARYRKIHLFDAALGRQRILESKYFLPGKEIVTARVNGFCVGLTICYDVRFPELYQELSRRGVDVLCIPSAFTQKTGQAHWEVLLRARAIETLSFVLAPNQFGSDNREMQCYGHSVIVGPWGNVVARAPGRGEKIIFADLDKSILKKSRQMLPGIRKF